MWRWAVLISGLSLQAAAAEPGRFALVIGNSTYAALPALPACAASANVVTSVLRRAGFSVTTLSDASNGQMGAAISQFGDTLAGSPGAVAIAYACGYAVGYDGRMFLLPSSARLERETDALTQGLVARAFVTAVTGARLQGGVVLLDTVTRPGGAAVPLGTAAPARSETTGVAAVSAKAAPAGTTVLSSAFAAEMGADVEVGPLLERLQAALQSAPGVEVAVQPPTRPVWLVGGPAAAPPAPPPPAPVAAPVAVPPAPPLPTAEPATRSEPVRAAAAEMALLGEADRRRVQLALQRLGYYTGQVDGRLGPESLAAVRRYQHELGADMTGRLTGEQVARLLQDAR